MDTVRTVGVIGAGTMGNGIAQACATSGVHALMIDVSDEAADKGRQAIAASLERLVKKDKLSAADRDAALARVRATTRYDVLANVDMVIEAATENPVVKLDILRKADGIARSGTVIASNTSSISITQLAAVMKRPDRFLGIHFFNPVSLMTLVELIRGLQTSDETVAFADAFARRLGKTPVHVRNSPGFVVNRLLCPMLNEAIFALQDRLATAEAIDEAMRLGCNHPIGPLALADMIGLDVLLAVMNVLYADFNDPKYRPAPLLREMVAAGWLGKKSGKGFYEYPSR